MDFYNLDRLPDGLSQDDALRLSNYASRIVEHAVHTLAYAETVPTSSTHKAHYIYGLRLCAPLAPAAVELRIVELGNELLELVSKDKRLGFAEALEAYHQLHRPLSRHVSAHPDFDNRFNVWLAFCDVREFVRIFEKKTYGAGRSSQIVGALESSLEQNKIISIFNASQIFTEVEPPESGMPSRIEIWFHPPTPPRGLEHP